MIRAKTQENIFQTGIWKLKDLTDEKSFRIAKKYLTLFFEMISLWLVLVEDDKNISMALCRLSLFVYPGKH